MREVIPYMTGTSTVDMCSDRGHAPSQFTMAQWMYVKHELRDMGKAAQERGDLKGYALWRVNLALNVAQENYGNLLSVVGHQCGRLLTERAVHYLLGTPPPIVNGIAESLSSRIEKVRREHQSTAGCEVLIADLHKLRNFGNRVDHENLDDIKPDEKPEIVHCAFRVAVFVMREAHAKEPRADAGRDALEAARAMHRARVAATRAALEEARRENEAAEAELAGMMAREPH
jgi:hypothetical protein